MSIVVKTVGSLSLSGWMVIKTHRKVIGVVIPMQVDVIFEVKYEDVFFLAAEQAFYLNLS